MKKITSFLFFLVLTLSIQWIGSLFTFTSVNNWYQTLKKPAWNPPGWVFGFVWPLLYLMIAISGWLIFIKIEPSKKKTLALFTYGAGLLFNLAWTYSFFFLKSPVLALADLLILITLTSINTHLFLKLYRPSGLLLIPYLLWSLFALSLNLAILLLNP